MSDSFSVKALVSAKDVDFSSTFKGAMKAMDKFESSIKGMMNTTDSLGSKLKSGFNFGILTGMGQKAFSTISSSVSDMVGEMNSSNVAWKTFEGNMKILEKGEKEVNEVKSSLQKFAEETIYNSSDMASTYAQLAAVGVKNADKLVKGFGGLAAAAEDPKQAMKSLSQQATQMAAKPKVAWADFKIMMEQSPAGISAVAKELGYTSKELVALVQDTKGAGLATDKFLKAVEKVGNSDGFSDLATKAKSVGQAMDGLKETVGNKLIPVFDMFSKKGIKAIDIVANRLGKIDATKVANKLAKGFGTASKYINAFKTSFKSVGSKLMSSFNSGTSSLSKFYGKLDDKGSIEKFKATMDSLADKVSKGLDRASLYWNIFKKNIKEVEPELKTTYKACKNIVVGVIKEFKKVGSIENFNKAMNLMKGAIKSVSSFLSKHQGTIIKLIPLLIKLAIAYKGLKIIKSVIPGMSLFGNAIGSVAKYNFDKLTTKIFNTSKAQEKVGKTSGTSGNQMLSAAKSYALMGVAVLTVAAGFALLAFSAIKLANSGGAAIGTMAGLVVLLAALGAGMVIVLKTLAPIGNQLMPVATSMLVMAAAVVVVAVGFALLATSAIGLAKAGPAAIGTMAGLVVSLGLLGVGMVVLIQTLAPMSGQLMLVAVSMVVLGAAVIVIAAGFALLAYTAISLANAGPTAIAVMFGLVAAIIVLVAVAAVLGPALTAGAVGFLAFGAAILMVGAGALLAAVALAVVASVLPIIVSHGIQGAISIVALGASLYVFAAGATIAAVGCLALGVALAVVAVTIALIGPSAIVAGTGMIVFGAGLIVAGAGALVLMVGLKLVNSSMKSIAKNAKTTQKSLSSMQKSVKTVSAGLDAIGNKAKSAMNKLKNAFNNTASKVRSSGKKVGTGFSNGMKSGLNSAPGKASAIVKAVNSRLNAGSAKAYTSGAYISIGFAQGMLSQLSLIQTASNKIVAAADKAIRAKARIHSPSRMSDELGGYFGQGWVNGILGMVKYAKSAVQKLISVPTVDTPNLAFAGNYNGELAADYDYYRNADYTIEVPLNVDGKAIAKATASYTANELDKIQSRSSRKHGKV